MTTLPTAPIAVFSLSFPAELAATGFLPTAVPTMSITSAGDLSAIEGVAAVLAYSDAANAEDCPAMRFLESLRISQSLPVATRSLPVVVLCPSAAETLLRLDPRFLAFMAPGTVLLRLPCSPEQVLERVVSALAASPDDVARYLDLEGRLAKIRHLARHQLANALGPRVLLASAAAAGVVEKRRLGRARADLDRVAPLAGQVSQYESLMSLLHARPAESVQGRAAAAAARPLPRLSCSQLRVLLVDDEHQAGWPEALAACLGLHPAPPQTTAYPVRSYARGSFGLDVWTGENPSELAAQLLPPLAAYPQRLRYDAVLLDLRLRREAADVPTRDLSGYQLLHRIQNTDPSVACVLFTASQNAVHLRELLRLGAAGYYLKEDTVHAPVAANWERLEQSLEDLLENRYRRHAFWAIVAALDEAATRPWYAAGPAEFRDTLLACVYHLQALVLLRDGPESQVTYLRMHRHLIEAAHSVFETALRLRFPAGGNLKVGDIINVNLGGAHRQRGAAKWLNQTRNAIVHEQLSSYEDPLHADRLRAVSAACLILSEEVHDARDALRHADCYPAAEWPQWLPQCPLPLRKGAEVNAHVVEALRRPGGGFSSLIVEEDASGEPVRVTDPRGLSQGREREMDAGTPIRIRITAAGRSFEGVLLACSAGGSS